MNVTYDGPAADGVEIAETGQWCKPGEVITVSDELGKRLCEQSIWKPAPTSKNEGKPAAPPKKEEKAAPAPKKEGKS